MKLLITGFGRHAKDTASEYIASKYGLKFISSSEFVGQKAVYPHLKAKNPSLTWEQCFIERHQNRALWYNLITEYNTPNLARLGTELFEQYDIYCGLRNIDEFNALKTSNVFDHSIWIDASKRLPPEPSSSMTIKPSNCDYIIDNNTTIENLYSNLDTLMQKLILQEI